MSGIGDAIKRWANAGLNFIYPEVCQLCGNGRATPAEGYVCAQCWLQVRFIRAPFCDRCGLPFAGHITTKFDCTNCHEMELHFTSARSAVVARGVVLEVIHRFKYQQAQWFEPFLADLLVRAAAPELCRAKWDYIVPVPLHPLKQRERSFNQAERMARALSVRAGIPLHNQLLRRRHATRTQTLLTRAERAANVRRAFALRPGVKLRGERLVLVDDVFTTGATTSACAAALVQAGAGAVCVWTVARGL
jgi:ComF family protein